MAPKAAGSLLASLACWEAASRLLAGKLEEESLDEVLQVATGWYGLMKKRLATSAKPSSTPLFVDLAVAVSREMPAEGAAGETPTVLEKEVKVFRDPEEESQGVFLLRALTHLCRCLSGHASCLILESCHLRLGLYLPGGSKPLARPVVCFHPCDAMGSERKSPSHRDDQPTIRRFPTVKDAQAHILEVLQRVWLRQSSSVGAGGHVTIWVVVRRGDGSPALMEHVQGLRKKEKALAIVKRRQELERLAARMTAATDQPVRRRQSKQEGGEEDRAAASPSNSSRGGRDSARGGKPETHAEDDEEVEDGRPSAGSIAAVSELQLQQQHKQEEERRGRTPRAVEEERPLSARPASGGLRRPSPRHASPSQASEEPQPAAPHRLADQGRPRVSPPRPVSQAASARSEDIEPAVHTIPSPPPRRRSPECPAPSPRPYSRGGSKRPAEPAVTPRATVDRQEPQQQQQEEEEPLVVPLGVSSLLQSVEAEDMQALAARVYQTVKQQVLGVQEPPPEEENDLLQSVEAEDVQALAARVYQTVKQQVLGVQEDDDEEEDDGRMLLRRSDSGVRYRSGLYEQRRHDMGGRGADRQKEEQVAAADEEGDVRPSTAEEGVVTGQDGEEEEGRGSARGKRRGRGMEELLESLDGEDIDMFGRRLYDVCKAMALRDTLLEDGRQEEDGAPVVSSWDEGLLSSAKLSARREQEPVRRSVAVMESHRAQSKALDQQQQQDEEEASLHGAEDHAEPDEEEEEEEEEEEKRPMAGGYGGNGYEPMMSAMEDDVVLQGTVEVPRVQPYSRPTSRHDYHHQDQSTTASPAAAADDDEEEEGEEEERSWRLMEEEGRLWSRGQDELREEEGEDDEEEEGRSVGEQLAMEEGRAEWGPEEEEDDDDDREKEEEGRGSGRRWGSEAQHWHHHEPTAPMPSPSQQLAHDHHGSQQQGYGGRRDTSPLARSLESGEFAGQAWQQQADDHDGHYWEQQDHGPSTGLGLEPQSYSPSAPLTQSLLEETSDSIMWQQQQQHATDDAPSSRQAAWPSSSSSVVAFHIPLPPTAPSPPPPPPAAALAPVPPAYIPPPRSPIVPAQQPASTLQHCDPWLPEPSAPPPPPPAPTSFLPPLGGGSSAPQGPASGQQLLLEWQVQRAREQIAQQEQAAEQRRQEAAMRVKMEALKAVLGIAPVHAPAAAAAAPPQPQQVGLTPRASHTALAAPSLPVASTSSSISSCPTLPPAKGAVPIMGVRTGGARPPARTMQQPQYHRQRSHGIPSAEPQSSALTEEEDEVVVVVEEEEEEVVVVVEEKLEKSSAHDHHRHQHQHKHQKEQQQQQGEGKGRAGQGRRAEEARQASRPASAQQPAVDDDEEEEEQEQPGSRVMEWDVDGSQSPEERRRRQARLEAVRARKMKEAQEREEARRARQHQQTHRRLVEQKVESAPTVERTSPSVAEAASAAAAATSSSSSSSTPAAAGVCERAPSARRSSSIGSASSSVMGGTTASLGSTGARGVSNAKLIRNALQHVCLAGTIMATQRQKALEAMEAQPAGSNFVVLFNSSNALTFRGLYLLEGGGMGDASAVRKVFGAGPMFIKDDWVEHFYKYNSASRCFQPLEASKSFSVMTDGVTLDLSKLRRVAKDTISRAK